MTQPRQNVVIIGGTGHFGARMCRRLLDEPGIRLYVASRREEQALNFAAKLQEAAAAASIVGVALDYQSGSFEHDLRSLQPTVVVHTAGPFQGQDYRVAQACLACGSHYVDLADGRDFVERFPVALNDAATGAQVLMVSGASTLPGLSSAVVQELTDAWQSVRKLAISIAPAQQTPRGLSTIRAVLSYCGQPFEALIDGRWQRRHGWQSIKLQHYPKLGRRLSAVCDVPDLSLFPQRIATLKTVVFHAALESKLEHVALWCFAALSRVGLLKDWARFARSLQSISRLSQGLGGDVGAMRVEVEGLGQDGQAMRCQWNLIAGQNHGPEIPVSPALVLVRQLVRGQLSLRGAHACFGLMSLNDFAAELAQLDIHWTTLDMPAQ